MKITGWDVDCILYAKVASLKLIRWEIGSQVMIPVEARHDTTFSVAVQHEQDKWTEKAVLKWAAFQLQI